MSENGDYISREAAIEYLTLNMGWNDEDGYPVDDWDERKAHIADLINGIPAADVRPVVNTCETCGYKTERIRVKPYDGACWYWKLHSIKNEEWCCHWKKREEN